MNASKIVAAWLPGLPHILNDHGNAGYKSLRDAAREAGKGFHTAGVQRILYYSTQWLSVLGHSIQTRAHLEGVHIDENWYDFGGLPFEMTIDSKMAEALLKSVSDAGYQVRKVDYEGFPIDTGTIVADSLINPNKVATGMFSCCVYSDYNDTKRLGAFIKNSLEGLQGVTGVVIVSGLSGRFFTSEIDLREDHIRSVEDDAWNKRMLKAMGEGRWTEVARMKDNYCKSTKADMGLKGLAFLEGLGVAIEGNCLKTRAYSAVYGTGAAVLESARLQ
ncbi:MAG: hypothetical protein NTV34_08895 [Proteobacteria bacterium]|nr:hypothetical protein [Pseudomonadota bacterium]